MMKVPAHKQTDPSKLPGQIKFKFDSVQTMGDFDEPSTVPNPEFINMHPPHSLGEYLEKKYPEDMKKKLTFEEWWAGPQGQEWSPWGGAYDFRFAEAVWKAAQENK